MVAREALDHELTGADGQGGLDREYRQLLSDVLDELLPETAESHELNSSGAIFTALLSLCSLLYTLFRRRKQRKQNRS